MISDSVPWKIELLRIADRLEKRQTQKRWSEQSFFLAERDVMLAAYIIRKLIEAKKLSDDVTGREVVVIQHPLSGRVPDLMSYERVWKNYDLQAGVVSSGAASSVPRTMLSSKWSSEMMAGLPSI